MKIAISMLGIVVGMAIAWTAMTVHDPLFGFAGAVLALACAVHLLIR